MKRNWISLSAYLIVSAILLAGCSTYNQNLSSSTQPLNPPGRIELSTKQATVFERIKTANDRQSQDFRKSSSVTYSRVAVQLGSFRGKPTDQQEILGLEGTPDYHRSFQNFHGDKIDEWLYMEKNYQIQFKNGILVYCGQLDDQAKLVLQYGQPTKITVRQMAGGQQNELFWYRFMWKMLVFSEGKLVIAQ